MLELAALLIGLSVGGTGQGGPPPPSSGDTVAVLIAAYLHHVADKQLDSIAVNVETDPEQAAGPTDELLMEVAAELELPVARESEVVWCAEELTVPRHCELRGLKHLVMFGRPTIEDDRAVIWVDILSEWVPGRVDGAGTQYELRRTPEGWRVEKALMQAAT